MKNLYFIIYERDGSRDPESFKPEDGYTSREEALQDAAECQFLGEWEYSHGEDGYILIHPDGEEEYL